jgi:hypothetical protein
VFLPVYLSTEASGCKFTEIILYILAADVVASLFMLFTDDLNRATQSPGKILLAPVERDHVHSDFTFTFPRGRR